jgi:hypothetical protein
MDGDREFVREPKTVMGFEDRASALRTSSERSPE